ncbi:hypothetical protein [Streptomyces sp. P5-A9]|uniref:hypothetical protein n=1 Tax=Streptomyces sp. P5-A9 TaxID=3071730 RepID=UPI003FCD9255
MTAVACLAGVGLLLATSALRALHAVAERERRRLTRWGPNWSARDRRRPGFGQPSRIPPPAGNCPG